MKYRIIAIGRPRLGYAAAAVGEYRKRLARDGGVEVHFLKEKDATRQLLERSAGTYRVALDERGEQLTTADLAGRMETLAGDRGVKGVSFLIGGSDGHDEDLRAGCDLVLALSGLTLQHELALVVLLEQLYRVSTIRRGEPYHRY